MKSNLFKRGDCRKHGELTSRPCTLRPVKGANFTPSDGKNRNQRRTEYHFRGIRMNSWGFPLGFNAITWQDQCNTFNAEQRANDASRGAGYKAPDKTKRTARPQDFIFKGWPGSKILRKMLRRYGVKEVVRAMSGKDRGKRNRPSSVMKGVK